MKQYTGLIAILVFAVFNSSAQTSQTTNTSHPVVTKGYYSIGNNNQKLSRVSEGNVGSTAPTTVQKGFFSIRNNNRKLPLTKAFVNTGGQQAPTKGYYSIGNNAVKLNERKNQ